jgi:nicotinamidase-related amidase
MATVREGGRQVLLVVDFQVDVVTGAWDAPRVTANVVRAVERARAQGVPVVWVQHEADDMPRDSAGWRLVPELVPREGETRLYKRYSSSFEQTALEQELARHGASHIVLAGAQSNWCIRAAAYAALERGYDLTLVADAHTTLPIEQDDGRIVEARSIVDDLNLAMTWLNYPGRATRALTVQDLTFS